MKLANSFSFVLLTTVIIIIKLIISQHQRQNVFVVDAKWVVTLPGGRSSILETNLGGTSAGAVTVTAKNVDNANPALAGVKFKQSLQADRTVFPGKCTSDQPNLLYGWETYKNEMIRDKSISVNLNTITMQIYPRMGFSITTEETITCGPMVGDDGTVWALGSSPSPADATFQFVIARAASVSVSLFSVIKPNFPPYITTVPLTEPDSSQLQEGKVRDLGLKVYIVLSNDNWNADLVSQVGQYLTCGPLDKSARYNCFDGVVTPSMFKFTTDVPCLVSLELTRDQTRLFNINETSLVLFQLPSNGLGFTMKNVDINQNAATNSFKVIHVQTSDKKFSYPQISLWGAVFRTDIPRNPATGQPYRGLINDTTQDSLTQDLWSFDPYNTYTVEERCLRGKIADVNKCNRTVLFVTKTTAPQLHSVIPSSLFTTSDIKRYALTSLYAHMNEIDWLELGGFKYVATQGMFVMNDLPAYETWGVDTITITPPFSCFSTLEPPVPESGIPLRLIVTPSPGDYVGGLRDVEQKEIWKGELVQRLILDGESWTQASLDNLTSHIHGSIAIVVATSDRGFESQKAFLMSLPNFATYPVTAYNRSNTTIMEIRFRMMPEYEMSQSMETISIDVTSPGWGRSGLPFGILGPTSFVVTKSPGELSVSYKATIEEAYMQAGGFALNLTMVGERWADPNPITTNLTIRDKWPNCKIALCQAWNSTMTVADDPTAWITSRSVICNPNNMTQLPGQRTVVMFFAPDANYDTKRGETITIRVPGACTDSGVDPIFTYPLEVLPQNGYVYFWVSYDGGVSVQNLTAIAEGDIREAKAMIIVHAVGDSWDERPGYRANVSKTVFDNTLADSYGTYGWNNKKGELIAEATTNLMKLQANGVAFNITFTFNPVSTFDIAANETVHLDLLPWFMASGRAPIIPVINFTIYAAPGVIQLVDWAGAGTNYVTEDDIRWGRVWFQFRIVGEQWRRDNVPFIKSFSSNDTSPTSLNSLIGTLIPAVKYFNFTATTDGYEYLRLTLQSQELYDIDRPENVTIALDPNTVVSGIQPVFDFGGVRTSTYSFIIYPASPRVLMSGVIDSLNEKIMRQSKTTTVFLTLIGDTWRKTNFTNASAPFYVRSDINSTALPWTAQNTRGFAKLNTSILPLSSITIMTANPHILKLQFIPDRSYKLNTTEVININIVPPNETVVVPVVGTTTTSTTSTTTSTTSTTTSTTSSTTSTTTTSTTTSTTSTTTSTTEVNATTDPNVTTMTATNATETTTTDAPTTIVTSAGTPGTSAPAGSGPTLIYPTVGVQPPLSARQPAVNSYYPPYYVREPRLYIDASGGELRFAMNDPVITEADIRANRFIFAVAIDGDTIYYDRIVTDTTAFLNSGLVSASSILAEPDGFTKNRDAMLNIDSVDGTLIQRGTDYLALMSRGLGGNSTSNSTNATTTTTSAPASATTTASPTNSSDPSNIYGITAESIDASFSFAFMKTAVYNLRNTEYLTLTMANASFFGTGITPDPKSITLTVKKVPQVMRFHIDVSITFARTFQIDKLALKTRLATLLAIPVPRVETQVDPVEPITSDSLLNMRVWFVDDASLGTTGYLSNAYLTDTFMSLLPSYQYKTLAAKKVFLEDAPLSSTSGGAATTSAASDLASGIDPVYGIIGAVFILLGAVAFFVGLTLQRARLSLSSIRPAALREAPKIEGKFEDEEMAALEADRTGNIDEHVVKSTASPFFVGRAKAKAKADAEAAKRNTRLRQANEEGIQVTTQPMSLRSYARIQLAKNDTAEGGGKGIAVGLDALGLSPKDMRNPGLSLDEEMAGEKDEQTIAEEQAAMRKDGEVNHRYHSVAAADRRSKLDGHYRRHAYDHRQVIDLLADL